MDLAIVKDLVEAVEAVEVAVAAQVTRERDPVPAEVVLALVRDLILVKDLIGAVADTIVGEVAADPDLAIDLIGIALHHPMVSISITTALLRLHHHHHHCLIRLQLLIQFTRITRLLIRRLLILLTGTDTSMTDDIDSIPMSAKL